MAEEDVYTKDGTVDYLGNPANRKETGTWRACPFIIGTFSSFSITTKAIWSQETCLTVLAFINRKWILWTIGVLWDELQSGSLFQAQTEPEQCYSY